MIATPSDIAEIIRTINRGGRGRTLLLVVAFDGTLTSYDADPRRIVMSEQVSKALRRIARDAHAKVVIVSGRRLFDLRCRVNAGGELFYVGLHGLEVYGPGVSMVRWRIRYPRESLQRLARTLGGLTWELPGVWVEDKDVAVALHTRAASPRDAEWASELLLRLASRSMRAGHLRLVRGNRVLELIPEVSWTKLDAIWKVVATIPQTAKQPVFPVCIGDDTTDRDLFRGLGETAVTIAVGRGCGNARFRLADPDEVATLLRRLADSNARAA